MYRIHLWFTTWNKIYPHWGYVNTFNVKNVICAKTDDQIKGNLSRLNPSSKKGKLELKKNLNL